MQLDGSRIRSMREYRGLTQRQLADSADTTVTQISRLENNERPGAQVIIVARIAEVLNTTVDYLVGLTDDSGIPSPTGNGVRPEVLAKGKELIELWQRLWDRDPVAAEELIGIAFIQAQAFETAVNAALRHIKEGQEQNLNENA